MKTLVFFILFFSLSLNVKSIKLNQRNYSVDELIMLHINNFKKYMDKEKEIYITIDYDLKSLQIDKAKLLTPIFDVKHIKHKTFYLIKFTITSNKLKAVNFLCNKKRNRIELINLMNGKIYDIKN